MKNLNKFTIPSFILILIFSSCSLLQKQEYKHSKKISRVFEAGINIGDAVSLYSQLNDSAKRKLPPPALQSFLSQVRKFCGRIDYMGEVELNDDGGIFYPKFSSGLCLISYFVDNEFKLSGFSIKPYKYKIPPFKQNLKDSFTDRVHDITDHYFYNAELIGLAVGIIDHGKISYYFKGHQHFSRQKAITEKSIFEIGSISKVFTGVLLADAIISKELKLSDKIKSVLPALKSSTIRNVSLESLSLHKSGLPRLPDDLPMKSDDPYGEYNKKKLLNYFRKSKIKFKPADKNKVNYSNLGVALLATGLENFLGKSYEELLQQRIAAPGELVSLTTDLNKCPIEFLAHGHTNDRSVSHWTYKAFKATGGIYSNLADMTMFLKNLFTKEGSLRSHLDVMIKSKSSDKSRLGLFMDKNKAQTFYWHNGGTGGFTSYMSFDIENQYGIVILNNSYDAPITELGNKVMTGL
jgi:CubicO group peptidase (beta-lactamase class C family)